MVTLGLQLERRGQQEKGRVEAIEDEARPWRTGWHPPVTPIPAARPERASQEIAELRPTFHRNRAGDIRDSSFTIFVVVLSRCTEGSAPWPLLAAIDTSNKFRIEISADLKEGQSCYTLLFGNVARQSPLNVDMERTQIIAVRKEKTGVRWWINGDECDAIAPGTLVTEVDDKNDPIKQRMKSRMSSRNSSVRSQENEAIDLSIDQIYLGRSVVEVEGILSEHKRHHFFDGNLAELIAYRAALSKDHVDEIGKYLAGKFEIAWLLKWRRASSTVHSFSFSTHSSVAGLIVDLSHPERAMASLTELRDLSCNPVKAEEIATYDEIWDRISSFTQLPNEDLQRLSFILVGNLAFYSAEGKAALTHRNFMHVLLDSVLHSESVHVEAASCEALGRWCENDSAAQMHLISIGGLAVIGNMVASSNSRVKSSGCQLLSNMLSDPIVSEIVLAEDSISSMTGAFLELLLVDDIRIQSIAARVLWTLAEIPERRQKLIQDNALEYIVKMIGARHDELQSAAMQVLSKFLCHEPKLLQVVLNHPILPVTLVDLASFAQREDVVGRALNCIFYMCVRDEHAVKVCDLGLLDALLILVRRQEALVITNSMMIIAALSHLADQMKYLVKEHIARDLIKIRESDVGKTVENLACAAIGMFIKNFEGRELMEVKKSLMQDNVLDYLLETIAQGYTDDYTIVYEGCKSLMYFAAQDHAASEFCARKALKDLLRISRGEKEISRLSLRSYILRALPEETLTPEQLAERSSERPRHLEWQGMRTIAAVIYGGEPQTVRYVLERGGLSAVISLCLTGPYQLRQEGARAISTVCLHCSSPEFCYEDYTVNSFREIANSRVIEVYIQVSLDPSSPAYAPAVWDVALMHACRDASAAAYDVLSYLHNFVDNETFVENSDPTIR
ncbi:hypothetical protein GUITHDRAFT_133486 [Guillardia theta CCMP2712]|uniref:Uncharacterized protein n=1 Tax=Guillardia theta (strain CCMP2712) TaxID=905079 RepID=L1JXM0_GUITC|nr:hypothetical protein GUITHDRAFT_133486 [Guillardia theta CCMP2712]EKX53117.1 hypothetical protein GUITHDRAFT_133486 [Guillardia theta CCMP2712]|eukprot:XP_005840097.1 hypothetical protein GUITHDRAFT_133486 [Guillardia theta CCMP2712]